MKVGFSYTANVWKKLVGNCVQPICSLPSEIKRAGTSLQEKAETRKEERDGEKERKKRADREKRQRKDR